MVDLTGPNDQEQVTNVPIDPLSNNPIEVTQTSYLETVPTDDGVNDDGFEASVTVTGGNVAEQINIAIVIDQSGSTQNDSRTDFTGDGNTTSILVA